MQPISLLNLEAHTQGFLDACSPFHKVETGYTGLLSHQPFDQKNCLSHPWPSQALEQNPLLMDDILEQLLSCSELGGLSGIPLNQSFNEIPESDLAECRRIVGHQVVPGFMDEKLHAYDHTTVDDSIMLVSQMQQHQGGFYPDHDAAVCSANSERNSSYGVPHDVAAQLSQPFVSGFPHFKMMPGNVTPEVPNLHTEQTPRHMQLLGKRCRDPAASMDESSSPSTPGLEKLFHLTGMEQVGKSHNKNTVDQQSAASPSQLLTSKAGLLQPQTTGQELPGTAAQPPVRPRVRARRGQATDPHSIAERLRRERIAERMKSLQELVPNSNKTDKASMLDEIIEYVKFLQLQVKVLSMSRLGGARVAALSTANLHSEVLKKTGAKNNEDLCPSQNAVGLLENQIAQLMEEDMGTAMQYLQNKGLCLMPIALANAISSKNNSPHSQINGTDVTTTVVEVSKQAMEAGICDEAASSLVELLTAKDSSAGEHITINAPNDAAVTRSRKKTTEIKHKDEI